MSQPDAHPYAISNVMTPALDGIVHALSDRGGQTEARREAKADQFRTLILSFQPRDAVEAALAGQAVLFSEVLADSARDVLRGMDDARKPRAISGLISMARLVQGNIDRLKKLGNQPYRTEAAAADEEIVPSPVAEDPAAEPPQQTHSVAAAAPDAPPQPACSDPNPAPETLPAAEEPSWLDAPFEQWLIETPADLARKAGLDTETPADLARKAGLDTESPADLVRKAGLDTESPADLARKAGPDTEDVTPAPVRQRNRRTGRGAHAPGPLEPAMPPLAQDYASAEMLVDAEVMAAD